ncbi:MAG TPA: exodeoxyribonuclease VII small subunit [Oscillospiraceae bacterium]|nr:exodeoxyribonuclease VII small subunit [Oscillospiraceae bacterium]
MNKNMTFETAIGKLSDIVAKLESGSESLDDSLKLFEEGTALASLCYTKLETAEQKIKQIAVHEESGEENND